MALRTFLGLDRHEDGMASVRTPDAYANRIPLNGDWMPEQRWKEAVMGVNNQPQFYQWATLAQGLSPISVLIDLRSVDANDHFIVRESILLNITEPVTRLDNADGEQHPDGLLRSWRQLARFELRTASGKLYVNDVEGDPTLLAIVQPTPGPWHARVDIAHIEGTSKPIRFLTF